MKIFALLLLMVSASAYAEGFDCRSKETGLRYVVDSKAKTVTVYEGPKLNKVVTREKFKKSTFNFYETFPATTRIQYFNIYGAFMEIVIKGSNITGSFDDDENLACSHN